MAQEDVFKKLVSHCKEYGFVFPSSDIYDGLGAPYDENGKRKPEFAGKLATYTPYTTRHTYASLCDRAGVNKEIRKRAVGHTPKSKTLDEVYLRSLIHI